MLVRILTGREVIKDVAATWYSDRIGEQFDVEDDPQFPEMYMTQLEHRGKMIKHHIFKDDCEQV